MPYGTIKVDTVTFTDAGVDKSVSISGLVQNPTFSGNITVTGTISGGVVRGGTVSGATVTGTAGEFTTATITSGVFASGTAAAPSITFAGDLDTGLFTSAANTLGIAINGVAALTVSGSNVGIGATSPDSLFEIRTSTATPQFLISNLSTTIASGGTIGTIDYRVGSSKTVVARIGATADSTNEDGAHIVFENRTAAGALTEKLRIDSSGRVGIGATPASLLHLSSTFGTTLTTGLRIDGIGTTTDNVAPISFYVQSSNWGTQHTANIACGNLSGTNGGGYLRFSTAVDGSAAPLERLRITSTGNIAIGTVTARAGLTVALGSSSIPAAGASTASAVFGNATDGGTYGVIVGANTSGIGYIQSQRVDGTVQTYDLALQPNGQSVLIGTTSNNTSAKLNVNGNINVDFNQIIALRYSIAGQSNAYYKGMSGTSLNSGVARGLHLFNYDQDSNAGINFYPNNYAGQTGITPALAAIPGNFVCINTATPVNIGAGYEGLTLNASNASTIYMQSGGTSRGRLIAGSTGLYIGGVQTTDIVAFQRIDGSYETMRIDASGRLLIGNNQAQAGAGANDLLQVAGAIQVVSSTNVYSRLVPSSTGLNIISNAYPANIGTTQNIKMSIGSSGGGGPNDVMLLRSTGRHMIGAAVNSTLGIDYPLEVISSSSAGVPAGLGSYYGLMSGSGYGVNHGSDNDNTVGISFELNTQNITGWRPASFFLQVARGKGDATLSSGAWYLYTFIMYAGATGTFILQDSGGSTANFTISATSTTGSWDSGTKESVILKISVNSGSFSDAYTTMVVNLNTYNQIVRSERTSS